MPAAQRHDRTPRADALPGSSRAGIRDEWYRSGWFSERTLADAFEHGQNEFRDVALTFAMRGHEITSTLGEISVQAVALAGALQGLGIRAGDAVAVQLTNGLPCAVTYQAVLMCGATLVPIVHVYGVAEVSFIVEESRAALLIMATGRDALDHVARVARYRAIETLRDVIVVDAAAGTGYANWSEMVERGVAYRRPRMTSDDVCLLLYTSGTTAAPKGVQHTHNTVLAELATMPTLIAGRRDDVSLVSFPPGHIAGVTSTLRALIQGTKTVFMDSWDAARASSLIERFGVTSTAGAPIHLQGILDLTAARSMPTLREFLIGAAPVSEDLGRRAAAAGITTFRSYGATEHPTVSGEHDGASEQARLGTDGKPLPGSSVRILMADGTPAPLGQHGEVAVKGPEQFIGYRDPKLDTAAFTPDGWFRTGDLGFLDEAGRLTITDRIKDVIIRGGETISAVQVEEVLLRHPAIAEGTVVAAPDGRYGEVVGAVVALKAGFVLDIESLRTHFAGAGLARQKTPERLVIVDALPRTALGKVKKQQVRSEHFG